MRPRCLDICAWLLTLAGSSSTEGLLQLSNNRVYAVIAGYNSAPGVASINSSSGVQRVVGRIDLAGASVSTGTIISDAFVGSSVRSAASVDGTAYWVGGASSSGLDAGIRYVVHGSSGASSDLFSSIQNMRATEIINGQLYAATASGPVPDGGVTLSRVFSVGTAVPTSVTTMVAYLPGVNISSPGNFVLLDQTAVAGFDTLYVTDTNTSAVGARKYTFDGTVWTLAATFPLASGSGFFVAARANSPTSVTVLLTCGQGVLRWDDTGITGTAPAGTLVIAPPTGTAFRGITFLP